MNKKMTKVLDVGMNFVRIQDSDNTIYTFQCDASVIKDDAVVEFAKKYAMNAVNYMDFEAYLELFIKGWKLVKVVESEDDDDDDYDDDDDDW
jgi:hypothetical protein